jgi:hypothetical protein
MSTTGGPPLLHKSFQDRELEVLRNAVDDIETTIKKKVAQSPELAKLIEILEDFLKKKELICYGGTALNNILPKEDQFYDKSIDVPDYDFYSSNALEDAKELADIYVKMGYDDVEAKSGMHVGTFKVQVNFIPLADITQMEHKLFKAIKKESIKKEGILYAPANFLRLNVYKELSRPDGQVDRWEKIYKRLLLLNKHYPIKKLKCDTVQFMRDFEGENDKLKNTIYTEVKNSIMDQGLVFFGGFAASLFNRYLSVNNKKSKGTQKLYMTNNNNNNPDFDALAEDPERASKIIKEHLEEKGIKNIKINKKSGAGEIIAPHYELTVNGDTVCFIYEPLGCHSYNTITINDRKIKIATIDTMLNLFLAFTYAERPYYDKERIICMAQYLFMVQSKNRLKQKGLLKRFTKTCYGKETTLQTIRENRANKFKELKHLRNKGDKEYEYYFLKYAPGEKKTAVSTCKKEKEKEKTPITSKTGSSKTGSSKTGPSKTTRKIGKTGNKTSRKNKQLGKTPNWFMSLFSS